MRHVAPALKWIVAAGFGVVFGAWVLIASFALAGYVLDRGFLDAAAGFIVAGIVLGLYCAYVVAVNVHKRLS